MVEETNLQSNQREISVLSKINGPENRQVAKNAKDYFLTRF
jgi:hypothetical protein